MAKIIELQRLYELWQKAKGHIAGIDIMCQEDSFKEWVSYFKEYPKKWREYQFKRFGIEKDSGIDSGIQVVSKAEYDAVYNRAW